MRQSRWRTPDPDHVVPLSRGGSNSIIISFPPADDATATSETFLLDEWRRDRESGMLNGSSST